MKKCTRRALALFLMALLLCPLGLTHAAAEEGETAILRQPASFTTRPVDPLTFTFEVTEPVAGIHRSFDLFCLKPDGTRSILFGGYRDGMKFVSVEGTEVTITIPFLDNRFFEMEKAFPLSKKGDFFVVISEYVGDYYKADITRTESDAFTVTIKPKLGDLFRSILPDSRAELLLYLPVIAVLPFAIPVAIVLWMLGIDLRP